MMTFFLLIKDFNDNLEYGYDVPKPTHLRIMSFINKKSKIL